MKPKDLLAVLKRGNRARAILMKAIKPRRAENSMPSGGNSMSYYPPIIFSNYPTVSTGTGGYNLDTSVAGGNSLSATGY